MDVCVCVYTIQLKWLGTVQAMLEALAAQLLAVLLNAVQSHHREQTNASHRTSDAPKPDYFYEGRKETF